MIVRRTVILTLILSIALCVFLIQACQEQDNRKKKRTATRQEKPADLGTIAALPPVYKSPGYNPSTDEKVKLGRLLFFDPILSGNKDVACATCHHPEFGYSDMLELPIGVNGTGFGSKRRFNATNDIPFSKRNAPSLINTAFNGINEKGDYVPEGAPMFWDIRVKSLELQSLQPIKQLEEMRGRQIEEHEMLPVVVKRLKAIPEYRKLFKAAFSEDEDPVTEMNMAKAIASFERTLVANNSRFDEFMRGDANALTASEKEGMQLFIESGCALCHNGPMLSDFKLHVLGAAENEEKLGFLDSGFNNTFAYRTPTLRNLRYTAPYMHSGKLKTLDQVMTFYEELSGKPLPNRHVPREQLDSLAVKIKVEFKNIPRIIEFLNTLNDDKFDRTIPDAVPSGLSVGGNIK